MPRGSVKFLYTEASVARYAHHVLRPSPGEPAESGWIRAGDDRQPNWAPGQEAPAEGQYARGRVESNVDGFSDPAPELRPGDASSANESVLIIDDCTLFRENLAAVLAVTGIPVSGLAWDLPSVVMAVERSDAGLALLDISTAGSDLLLRAIVDMAPAVPVIVFNMSEDNESDIVLCAEAGVAAYHMREDTLEDLITLIRKVAAGESFCPPQLSAVLLRRLSLLASASQTGERDLALTAREAQILKMLELGRSNRDIAMQLGIAVHTVKNHVHNLLNKLGASTRSEAAALSRAMRSGQGSVGRN
jgi:DNA-binding NarL/FixJ family response regulator